MPDAPMKSTLLSFFCAVGDGFTGIGLLFAPLFTLGMMGVAPLPAEPFAFRWIGAFVLSAGLAYLLPFLEPAGSARLTAMRNTFRMLTVIRILVTLIVLTGVLNGALPKAWISVPLYDGTFAVLQLLLLRTELRSDAMEGQD